MHSNQTPWRAREGRRGTRESCSEGEMEFKVVGAAADRGDCTSVSGLQIQASLLSVQRRAGWHAVRHWLWGMKPVNLRI
jgi:hypothetical protein